MVILDGFIKEIVIHVGLGPLAVDARVPLQLERLCARGHGLGGGLADLARAHPLQAAEPDRGLGRLGVQHLRLG